MASTVFKHFQIFYLRILPAVILAIAAFMAMLGRVRGNIVDLRLAGIGIPAFTHMAAALALAISSSCSLSEETWTINQNLIQNFNFKPQNQSSAHRVILDKIWKQILKEYELQKNKW